MALIDNLISYWKLDESSGSVLDAHGDNDGTNVGATPNVAGKINTAYDFDGSNDYISIPDNSGLDINNNDFSLNFWTNPDTFSGTTAIMGKGSGIDSQKGWVLYRDSVLGNMRFRGNDGSVKQADFTGTINTGSWQMITGVYDDSASTFTFYKDGSSVNTVSSFSLGDCSNSIAMRLGYAQQWNVHFNGKLDEVGIWERALTSTEITQLYNSGDGITWTDEFFTYCTFSGFVKDEGGTALVGANVTIWNQYNISESYSNTTNAQGSWKYTLVNSTNTYMTGAYYNNSLIGQLKPFISGTC